jgi:sirohydrochlorin ferrochelatase
MRFSVAKARTRHLPSSTKGRPLCRVGDELDFAAHQRLHPFRAALVGDMRELRAGRLLDLDHHQLAGAADARGAVIVLVRVLLAGGDHVLEGLPGRVGAHDDAHRVARQTGDVGEVSGFQLVCW